MRDTTKQLLNALASALDELQVPYQREQLTLEKPTSAAFGDYSSNAAMTLFSELKKNAALDSARALPFKSPRELADKIVERLTAAAQKKDLDFIQQISVAGPGFINFSFTDTYLLNYLLELNTQKANVVQKSQKGKQVVVEYSSPNIAKPFTIGHLRPTIIGDAVANLLEEVGYQVFRDNHLGDWGTQFGKQIYAIKTWGDEAALDASPEPVKELVALYVHFHTEAEKHPEIEDHGRLWFKKLEDGDPEARRLWKKCIDWSLKEFQRIYEQLGVAFTENNGVGYGESFFEDKMPAAIEELRQHHLLKKSEGAELVFFPDDKYPPLMILKKDGSTLYATRDLATDKFRLEHYGKDILVINAVGIEQSLYWQQIFWVEEKLGWYKPGQRVHLKNGHYRFKEGKMSTRKGNVIWLEEVLAEAIKKASQLAGEKHESKDKLIDQNTKQLNKKTTAMVGDQRDAVVGIGALKWNDLKRSSHLDVTFDWDEILSMDGNSGPYLQYTYARCQSVLRKAEEMGVPLAATQLNAAVSDVALNVEERSLLSILLQFDSVVQRAATEYAPHHLCTYLFEVAQAFNTFYNKHSILGGAASYGEESSLQQARVQFTYGVGQVLKKGLGLLRIETLEHM